MPFLTKGKTNWKYILILVILAIIVGGVILSYMRYFEREMVSLTRFPGIKKIEKQPKIKEKQSPEQLLHESIVKSFCDECRGCEEAIKGWGKLINVNYEIKNIDLNEDGINEIIAKGLQCVYEFYSSPIGGVTGNQSFRILQQQNDKWIKIGSISGENYYIKKTKTKGYYDIVTDSDVGEAGCLRLIEYYEWNGFYYELVKEETKNRCK